MATELAKAYVQIMPSMKGIKGALEKEFNSNSVATGEKAGKSIGSGIKSGLKGVGAAGLKVAGVAAAASTAAVAGFGASSVKAGAQFEEGMSKVSAISGAQGKELEQLKEKAKQMGASTKFSASESAEAFSYMAMAGWKTGDMLNGIEGVMNLAAASGEDLATTSDIVTDALTAFGYKASDSSHFADVLAVASSNANTNVGMMGETFKYVAPVAGSLGYGAEEVAKGIGLMANAGIKSSQAGTSLRSIMTRLSTDAGASNKSLGALGTLTEKLGVKFYNADGTVRNFNDVITESREAWKGLSKEEQANYAKKIAGQEAISGWNALMNASEQDVKKLDTALANADGTAKDMANTRLDNLSGDVTIFKSALEGTQIAVSESLTPALRDFVKLGSSGLSEITNGLNAGGLNGASEAIGKLLGNAVNMIVSKAPSVINAGMQLLKSLGDAIFSNKDLIINSLFGIINNLYTAVTKAVPSLLKAGVDIVLKIIQGATTMWKQLFPQLISLVINVANMITSPSMLSNLLNAGLTLIITVAKGIIDAIPQLVAALPQIISNIIQFLTASIPMILDAGIQLLLALVDAIPVIITSLVDALPSIIDSLLTFITDPSKSLLIMDAFVKLLTGVVKALPKITKSLRSAVLTIIASIITTIWDNKEKVAKNFMNMLSKVLDSLAKLGNAAISVGKDLLTGLWNGIKSKITWLKDKIKSVKDTVVGSLKKLFKINSPSKVMRDSIGKSIPEGIAVGIESNVKSIKNAAKKLGKATKNAVGANVLSSDYNNNNNNINKKNINTKKQNKSNRLSASLTKLDADRTVYNFNIPVHMGLTKIDRLVASTNTRNGYRFS